MFGFFTSNILVIFLYFFAGNLNSTFIFYHFRFIWPINVIKLFMIMWLSPYKLKFFLFLKIINGQFRNIHGLFWNIRIDICMVIVKIPAIELLFFLFKVHYYLLTVIIHFLQFFIGFSKLFDFLIFNAFFVIFKDGRLWDKNFFKIFFFIFSFLNRWFFWKLLLIIKFLFNLIVFNEVVIIWD